MIELRAFRGTRRRSVYRAHSLEQARLRRIRAVATLLDLPLLRSIDPETTSTLDRRDARRLAEETSRLRVSGELLDLDEDLAAIATLARWCQHDRAGWMTIS